MDLFRNEIGQRVVHEPVARHRRLADELLGYDHELEMSAAVLCADVPGVFAAVVEIFKRVPARQPVTDARGFFPRCVINFGKALRNGLTVTLANTPSGYVRVGVDPLLGLPPAN